MAAVATPGPDQVARDYWAELRAAVSELLRLGVNVFPLPKTPPENADANKDPTGSASSVDGHTLDDTRALLANACVKLARTVLDNELRVRSDHHPLSEAHKRTRANLAAALATLALEQQPGQNDAAWALAQAELALGHVSSAVDRLGALELEGQDETVTEAWHDKAVRLLVELHKKLWKFPLPQCTPASPAWKLRNFGDKEKYSWPISAASDGCKEYQQLTATQKTLVDGALRLVSPLRTDMRLVKDAMAARTPHCAKVGSWNLRCSAGYHECKKTLQAKLAHVAALAQSQQWSVIALQEVPGASQRSDKNAIRRGLRSKLGEHWDWHEVALSGDEVGGFAYDKALWTLEELKEATSAEKAVDAAFKRAPVCILLCSIAKPQTFLALASVHLKARSVADANKPSGSVADANKPGGDKDEDDAKVGADGSREPSESAMTALEATRLEVKKLAVRDGVAARLIAAAEECVAGQPTALAFVAVLGDFNLSWTTGDAFCNPIMHPGSQESAWDGLSKTLGFRALIADGRATNAHEVMLSRCEHCFDNCLVRLVRDAPPPRVRDASDACVAPWPPALEPVVEGLEEVVLAARSAAGDCAQLCVLAEAGIRRSVRDQMLREASDHRALTIVFQAAELN
jgi:endonuclease/exonuclease/phosphatase family metal-dependent hydrolase